MTAALRRNNKLFMQEIIPSVTGEAPYLRMYYSNKSISRRMKQERFC